MRIDYKEKPISERQIVPGYLEVDLKSGRFIEVWAINKETDERVQLVLNSQGQLCLLKGNSKILFDKRHKDFLMESIELEEIRTETREAIKGIEQPNKPRLGWGYWASKVTDAKTAEILPALIPEGKEAKKEEVTVVCTLPLLPKGTTISLEIEKYMDTFYAEAFAKKRDLGGQFKGFINVEAEIRNHPKLLNRLKDYLTDMSLMYTLTGAQPGFTMAKIVVHFDDYDLSES